MKSTRANKYNRMEYTELMKEWDSTSQTVKNFAKLALMQRALQRRRIKAVQALSFKDWCAYILLRARRQPVF